MADEEKQGCFTRLILFFLRLICWLTAICGLLLAATAMIHSKEYIGGALLLAGSILIMPVMNRLPFFRGKLTGHLRRSAAIVLLLVGAAITLTALPEIAISENTLEISREQMAQKITEQMKEMGQPVGETNEEGQLIGEFSKAEINETGQSNSYQIYEAKTEDNVSVQIIEHGGMIEAVRACAASGDYYEEIDQSAEQTISSLMDWLLDECGVAKSDKQAIASELDAKDNTGRVTKYNYIVEMRSVPYYRESVMIYNQQAADMIDQVNTAEIDDKLSVYDYLADPEQMMQSGSDEETAESWDNESF